ncbi:hypothetical protein Skr01_23110 [Sphaerisporangium krabiense]|nr:hypothetical protein Skr01_23110 [Sphaerisporangium krabiense]
MARSSGSADRGRAAAPGGGFTAEDAANVAGAADVTTVRPAAAAIKALRLMRASFLCRPPPESVTESIAGHADGGATPPDVAGRKREGVGG